MIHSASVVVPHTTSEFAVVSGPKKFGALSMNKNKPSSVMNTAPPKEEFGERILLYILKINSVV